MKIEEYDIYTCLACEDKPEFKDRKVMVKHLEEIHGMDPTGLVGKREMNLHIDGKDFYKSTFLWTLDCGITFLQHESKKREKGGYWG